MIAPRAPVAHRAQRLDSRHPTEDVLQGIIVPRYTLTFLLPTYISPDLFLTYPFSLTCALSHTPLIYHLTYFFPDIPIVRAPWMSTATTKPPLAIPVLSEIFALSTQARLVAALRVPFKTPRVKPCVKTVPQEITVANTTSPSPLRCCRSVQRDFGARGAPPFRTLPMCVSSVLAPCYIFIIHTHNLSHRSSTFSPPTPPPLPPDDF